MTLIPNLTLEDANQINYIINVVYGICIALMVLSVIYYTGALLWKIHHSSSDEEIKYLKKHYYKRLIAFICFLFLFVIIGIILGVLGPIIKNDETNITTNDFLTSK